MMDTKVLRETGPQLTLLYVGIDLEVRHYIENMLSRYFKKLVYAENSKVALDLFHKEKFDLILIDIDASLQDSLRLINNIRMLEEFQAIIVSSVHKEDWQLLLELIEYRVIGFLVKPIELEQANKTLSKVCGFVYDLQMMSNYVDQLEKAQIDEIWNECGEKREVVNATDADVENDDDFMFFDAPTPNAQGQEVDLSKFADYFSFLQPDDLEELRDMLSDIDSSLLNGFAEKGGNAKYISKLGSSLVRFGNVLMRYQFFADMGEAILELGKMIEDEHEKLAKERVGDSSLFGILSGFCSVLQTFIAEAWEKESGNPIVFNDSVINDATTIKGFITPPKSDTSAGASDDLVFF